MNCMVADVELDHEKDSLNTIANGILLIISVIATYLPQADQCILLEVLWD